MKGNSRHSWSIHYTDRDFLFHWDKSIYLEVTHFPSLCLGEATQPCRWQHHLHSWGEPSGAPFNHHFYPFFNPDRNHNSQTNQSDRAAALGQLSWPCSPPVNPRPLSNTSHLTLGNPTVLVEDVLRFFAHHLIQVVLCNVGHGHHYSSSSFSSSLPLVFLQPQRERATGLQNLNRRRPGLFATGDSPIAGRLLAQAGGDRDWAELQLSARERVRKCQVKCVCVGEREDSQRPSPSFSNSADFITSCARLKWERAGWRALVWVTVRMCVSIQHGEDQ